MSTWFLKLLIKFFNSSINIFHWKADTECKDNNLRKQNLNTHLKALKHRYV